MENYSYRYEQYLSSRIYESIWATSVRNASLFRDLWGWGGMSLNGGKEWNLLWTQKLLQLIKVYLKSNLCHLANHDSNAHPDLNHLITLTKYYNFNHNIHMLKHKLFNNILKFVYLLWRKISFSWHMHHLMYWFLTKWESSSFMIALIPSTVSWSYSLWPFLHDVFSS